MTPKYVLRYNIQNIFFGLWLTQETESRTVCVSIILKMEVQCWVNKCILLLFILFIHFRNMSELTIIWPIVKATWTSFKIIVRESYGTEAGPSAQLVYADQDPPSKLIPFACAWPIMSTYGVGNCKWFNFFLKSSKLSWEKFRMSELYTGFFLIHSHNVDITGKIQLMGFR